MRELTGIDLPGGSEFVDTLQRVWERGDAVFPVDRRLPTSSQRALLERFGASSVITEQGESHLSTGVPTEEGDALVVATSGSSGEPKGAVLTHAAIAASATATSARLNVVASDHWLACLPLAHIGGLSVITRSIVNATRLTVLDGFDAEAVARSDATLVSLVATALRRVDAARFRAILLGGSRAPAERPSNSIMTYGMTETGSGVVYDGLPLDGVELRIVDDEIHVRCPMLLRCYRDGTDPRIDGGWFPTGDLGSLDGDGRLRVAGRIGDVINTGGEKVWPEDVEAVLSTHPDVSDVAVTKRSDDEWGELVVANIVTSRPTLELDEIRDFARALLPSWSLPRDIVLVDSIPRTALGKIRRSELSS